MSLWPIIAVECIECDARVFASDYDLGGYEQQEFFDILEDDGWQVTCKARDIEADDDGVVLFCCPGCGNRNSTN